MPIGENKNHFKIDRKLRKKLESSEGTLALNPSASPLDRFRWEICQKFLIYANDHGLSQKELAEIIGIDKSKMSKILHHRIEEFSTDRLLNYYQMINPNYKIKIG